MGVVVLRAVVVNVLGELGYSAVAGVAAEPDGFAAAEDAPTGPQGLAFVKAGAGGGVLAGEAGDAGVDGGVWGFFRSCSEVVFTGGYQGFAGCRG